MRDLLYHNNGRVRRHDYPRVFRLYKTVHRRLRRERLQHWRRASQMVRPEAEQLVSYFRLTLSKPKRKYAVTRIEMLALVDLLRHFRCYILGRKFKVRTNHSAPQWLKTFKEPVNQVSW